MAHGIDFEPEILLPSDPFEAALIFFGSMAYPERGAGQQDGLGLGFAQAMWKRVIWSRRKAKGLRAIRSERGDPDFKPPELRDFQGIYGRGQRRMRRRAVVYSLVGTQLLHRFLAMRQDVRKPALGSQQGEAYSGSCGAKSMMGERELWERNTLSPRTIISADINRWSKRLGLNTTGEAVDANQKAKDLVRRAYLESRPVLHMAHAFDRACNDIGPTLPGWGQGDFVLIMLINCDKWIFTAIENALRWRESSETGFIPNLQPRHMISLAVQKPAG